MEMVLMAGAAVCAAWVATAATVERDLVIYGSSPAAIKAAAGLGVCRTLVLRIAKMKSKVEKI